jgi:ABC-type dipeptide/oligopeptide/nickel transport system ATPase component
LILDEPTTALDVTVEAAVVDLVKDWVKKYGTSMFSFRITWAWFWKPVTASA